MHLVVFTKYLGDICNLALGAFFFACTHCMCTHMTNFTYFDGKYWKIVRKNSNHV